MEKSGFKREREILAELSFLVQQCDQITKALALPIAIIAGRPKLEPKHNSCLIVMENPSLLANPNIFYSRIPRRCHNNF